MNPHHRSPLPHLLNRHRRRARLVVTLGLAAALLLSPFAAGRADDDEHHHISPAEMAAVRPLAEVIARIAAEFGGRALAVELESEEVAGRRLTVYEAKVLTDDGRVLKLYYDAQSLQLLRSKGERGRHRSGDDDDAAKDHD